MAFIKIFHQKIHCVKSVQIRTRKTPYLDTFHTVSFFEFSCIFKEVTTNRKNFQTILSKKICRLFHVLAKFLSFTKKTELHCYHQKVNVRVASRLAKQHRTQDRGKLGKFKKITERFGFENLSSTFCLKLSEEKHFYF